MGVHVAPDVLPDGIFSGYASLFGTPDLGGDVVQRGAFAASLMRRGAGQVRMLWQHDPAQPLGRWLDIREDARGLRVRGQLNLAVQRARELQALVAQKAVDGLSIGFHATRASRDGRSGLRRLLHVDLWEISLVTFPMQPAARIIETRGGGHEQCLLASIHRMTRALPPG
ncbi:primosomal replication protein N [Camelimonas fluminis]|uniref:HK97 family phage prohead protease n=1 Tax=Camelimonas fluminis TaxID=1576911 RepID=A0ABV7UP13_9HYPH|nr:HK97 family phage prohead protease [Camelimonas fluminis]GHE57488.1 primosomal replication protein N [Camelimonas fluminis]